MRIRTSLFSLGRLWTLCFAVLTHKTLKHTIMKTLNFKRVALAGLLAYVLGVTAFLTSFLVPVMDDSELQANLVLAVAIIPAAIVGARYYSKKDSRTPGVFVGLGMFIMTMALDAAITVPVFVIPAGGDYISFFTDPGFWLIAILYVTAVTLYIGLRRKSTLANG